jgi:hypothetical protein
MLKHNQQTIKMSTTNFYNLPIRSQSKFLLPVAGDDLQDLSPCSELPHLPPQFDLRNLHPHIDDYFGNEVERVHFWAAPYRSQLKLLQLAGTGLDNLSSRRAHGKFCCLRQKLAGFAVGHLGLKGCAKFLRD